MLCFVCHLVVRLGVWHVGEHYSSQYLLLNEEEQLGRNTMCQSWLMSARLLVDVIAIPELLLRWPEQLLL